MGIVGHLDEGPPELALLLACARVRVRPVDQERADAAVRQGVDWNRVIALAGLHGLVALVNQHAANGAVPMPEPVRATLQAKAKANAHHSLMLAAELVRLLRLFAEHGIVAVPLKGPVLAQVAYGSLALRNLRDLDLLVRRTDLLAVTHLLKQRGYAAEPEFPIDIGLLARSNSHHVPAVVSPTVKIEVHHCLAPHRRDRFSLDALAGRLKSMTFLGVDVPVLAAEDLFVYLCEHGSAHAWSRLEWLVAVRELLCRQTLDWDRVRAWAAEWGGERRIRATLALASELLGAMDGIELVEDGGVDAATRAVVQRLTRSPMRIVSTPVERLVFQLRTDASLTERVHRCRRAAFLPTEDDIAFVSLPRGWWPLYYGLRPVRLGLAGVTRLVRRLLSFPEPRRDRVVASSDETVRR